MNLKKLLPMRVNFEIRNFSQRLKGKTLELDDEKDRIFFLDAASYGNLGDQAIAHAMSEFIRDSFPDYEYVELSEWDLVRNMKYLEEKIQPKDIICLSGGGNMGNLYPKYESFRRMVIKGFPDNKIIIFPQTIDYDNDRYGRREKEISAKIYNAHKNLVVCARERASFDEMKELYNRVILVPDIVLYLYGRFELKAKKKNNVTGVCLRNDRESVLCEAQKEKLYELCRNGGYETVPLSTMADTDYIQLKGRRKAIIKKLEEFAGCSLIITDRLHGMIFSILAGVACIAIDNSNRKISGVYDILQKHIRNVVVIDKAQLDVLTELPKTDGTAMFDGADIYEQLCEEILNS